MGTPIKAPTATGRTAVDLIAAVLILIGGLLVIGCCVYRVFVCPEWTFDEALRALWPFFLAGAASLLLGMRIDRAER